MKQSTIKLILGLAIILGLLSSLTSCSQSSATETTNSQSNDNDSVLTPNTRITLRAVALGTGITIPVECLHKHDVYKIGDTVWVYQQNNMILTGDPMISDKEENNAIATIANEEYIIFRARVEEVPYERFPSK